MSEGVVSRELQKNKPMSRIKTRESVKDIKVIDKAAVASERMKTALVRSKDQFENLMDDGQVTPSEYAEDMLKSKPCVPVIRTLRKRWIWTLMFPA